MNSRAFRISVLLKVANRKKIIKKFAQNSFEIGSWEDLGENFGSSAQQDIKSKWEEYISESNKEIDSAKKSGSILNFNRNKDIDSFLDFFHEKNKQDNDIKFQDKEKQLLSEFKTIIKDSLNKKKKESSSGEDDELAIDRSAYSKSAKNSKDISYLVVHHSVTMPNNKDGSPKTKDQIVKEISSIHDHRGISGIAYHKLVLPNGEVVNTRPEDISPGSQKNYNKGTLAVCLIGYFHDGKDKLRPQQLAGLDKVLTGWQSRFPEAQIVGHRQIGDTSTACPGDDLFNYISSKYPSVGKNTKRIRN